MGRSLDGSPEESLFDAAVAALCGDAASASAPVQHVTLQQTAMTTVSLMATGRPDHVFVTDEDGTIIAFASGPWLSKWDNVSVVLPLGESRPSTMRAHAHYPQPHCSHIFSGAVTSWGAQLDDFNYEASGGVMDTANLTEATLMAAEPVRSKLFYGLMLLTCAQ